MKRLALVLAIIIAVSGVSNADAQGAFFSSEFAQELKESNLGRTILSFAQLASLAS